jgi:hypothetical protein
MKNTLALFTLPSIVKPAAKRKAEQCTALFCVYGFAKSDRDNIEDDERRRFKRTAKDMVGLSEAQIDVRLKIGTLIEIM